MFTARIFAFALLLLVVTLLDRSRAEDVLDAAFGVQKVASGCKFTEGPAVGKDGALYFSDGPNDRILRLSPDGELTVFLHPCGRANGLTFDGEGRLVMCQSAGKGGGRQVARREPDGTITTLAAKYDGRPFIAPNDLCIDAQGRVFFTDPFYGGEVEQSQPHSGVYRIDAPGKAALVVSDLQRPNGIVITPDNRLVYISDRGKQKLHRYAVENDGDLRPDGVIYDFSPDRGIDGMRLDAEGNIYGAAGQGATTGLFVISPEGKLLLHRPMPEFSTNVAFGGEDGRDLFLTATTSVYKMRTLRPGAPPAWKPGE